MLLRIVMQILWEKHVERLIHLSPAVIRPPFFFFSLRLVVIRIEKNQSHSNHQRAGIIEDTEKGGNYSSCPRADVVVGVV